MLFNDNHNLPLLKRLKEPDYQDYWLVWMEKSQYHFKTGLKMVNYSQSVYIPVIGHLHSKMTLDVTTLISTSWVNKHFLQSRIYCNRQALKQGQLYILGSSRCYSSSLQSLIQDFWFWGGGGQDGQCDLLGRGDGALGYLTKIFHAWVYFKGLLLVLLQIK